MRLLLAAVLALGAPVGPVAGPAAGLAIVDALLNDRSLHGYQWLPSVRGDLLAKLGRSTEAAAEFERAAQLAGNTREKTLLLQRAEEFRRVG